jgi:GNAT superfamily N-acetyltransferase
MAVDIRITRLGEIASLREQYRKEMNCQIIHDSIHGRPGWTREYVLELDGTPVGYGSVAGDGPWQKRPALYEFYLQREHQMRMFELSANLLAVCGAKVIETQTNDGILTVMLHTFARNLRAESILFEDAFTTSHDPGGASFRAATADDIETLRQEDLDDGAGWVVVMNGEIAGAGDVLYHYNRPYGDIYMKIAEPYRRKGLGAYLVQELKAACRASGSVPAARCNVQNLPSRKTLQRAGFVPCGNIVVGDLPE